MAGRRMWWGVPPGLALLLTGCTDDPEDGAAPDGADVVNVEPAPSPTPAEELGEPEVVPGDADAPVGERQARTLLTMSGRSGSGTGDVRIEPGDDIVTMSIECTGDGKLALGLGEQTFDTFCPADTVRDQTVQQTAASPGLRTIRVTAAQNVKWTLRVEAK